MTDEEAFQRAEVLIIFKNSKEKVLKLRIDDENSERTYFRVD